MQWAREVKPNKDGSPRLTKRQLLFAQALAVDPDRNQTHAALKAGAPKSSASVWACRTLKVDSVQAKLAELTARATRSIEVSDRKAVAKLSRVMEVLSDQMEGAAAAEWNTVTGEDGSEVVQSRRYKPQAAATALGTLLTAQQAQPAQHNTLILQGLDPEVLRALYRHMLQGQPGQAIEVSSEGA